MWILFAFLSVAFAGNGWVSSGGDIFRDANNPWWIQNKSQVTYCIEFDAQSMSTTRERASKVVNAVFENWLREWRFFNSQNKGMTIQLGTQSLKEIACDGSEDVSFRFGWGALTLEQQKYLQQSHSVDSILGMTVRTAYDYVKLQARGFVYIASDLGPNRFDAREDMYPTPWQHDFFLSLIIFHEIGHIFGLRHSDQFEGLMQEAAFEFFLSKEVFEAIFGQINTILDLKVFSRTRTYEASTSYIDADALVSLGLPKGAKGEVVLKPSGELSDSYDLYFRDENGREMLTHKLHTQFKSSQIDLGDRSVSVYLNKDQTVIPNPGGKVQRVYAYFESSETIDGVLTKLLTKNQKPVLLTGNGAEKILRHYNGRKFIEITFRSRFAELPSQASLRSNR